ncbi:HU family DNA-binding protein [Alysiella filiformis]|uniref:DNA-binding protein HU-beta n=1 Tax=Alysiella filiformis DSM 16848 TaxID=1120981 RepID=A0A286E1V0_9NEIS|nr:HU family DNA-binding protein [Alysiella filiformis]QMT30802.1 HU family DNA-binding protein [Alysiella filiformis]UBQ56217.1 HU family DNA-binding protein [Alysiella filiformis DSM 16848]SOD64871.1 DNA-binding protein HU-beta [Alysiella filiformis DSM 16848]
MNKSELIDAIAKESGLTKTDAGKALDAFTNVVKETLKSGGDITLVGFGSFVVAERAERQGLNPKTKEAITIPAARVPKFKPGKTLKDALLPAEEPAKKAPAKKAAKK